MTRRRVTKNFSRQRLVSPTRFKKRSFRTISIERGHKLIVGRLKGRTTTTAQAILHPRTESHRRTCKTCKMYGA